MRIPEKPFTVTVLSLFPYHIPVLRGSNPHMLFENAKECPEYPNTGVKRVLDGEVCVAQHCGQPALPSCQKA